MSRLLPNPRPGLAVLLAGLLLVGSAIAGLAAATAERRADTLEAAVAQAFAGHARRALQNEGIHVVTAGETGQWAFGTALVLDRIARESPPEGTFFVARQTASGWEAHLHPSSGFARLLAAAPNGLMAPQVRRSLAPADERAVSIHPGFSLPFPIGQTWYLMGGPHGDNRPPDQRPWSAIDLGRDREGATSGRVLAAAPGYVFLPCMTPQGRGPLVWVLHEGDWTTVYYHLADTAVANGAFIGRGRFLGNTSELTDFGPCKGTAVGKHVHFGLRKGNTQPEIRGDWFGSWKVLEGPSHYKGCVIQFDPHEQKVCRGGGFFNNGTIDRGALIDISPTTIRGRGLAQIEMNDFAPNRTYVLELSYTNQAGNYEVVLLRRVTTNGVGAKPQFSQRFPVPYRSLNATVCGTDPKTLESLGCEDIRWVR